MRTVKTAPTGTMNFDFDPRYLNEGAYRSAYNMRPLSDAGGSTMTMETVRGTREEFSLGTVPEQDKKIEIEFNKAQDVQFAFKVLDDSGNTILNGGGSGDLSQIVSQIDELANTTVSTNGPVAIVTFENGKDHSITVNDYAEGTTLVRNQVVQELLSGPDQTGELYLIGQYEYYDKLFLFSTTSTSANGGVGEIGVVTENPDGSLSYLRGLRSKELKFSTQYPIEATVEETDFRVAVYFTDNFNELRKFAYDAPVSKPDFGLAQNGGRYELDKLSDSIRLIPIPPVTQVDFSPSQGEGGQIQTGGALKSGTYRYAVRFLTEDLSETTWTTLTNQIPVFEHSLLDSPRDLRGSPPKADTSKINVIRVSGIDTQQFSFIELGAVRYVDTTPTGSLVKRVPITEEVMEITHTGNEENERSIGNLAEFSLAEVAIERAKNLSILDNRLFVSNITFGFQDFGSKLESVASNISVSWNQYELDGLGEEQDINAEYMLPINAAEKVGYASGETYRFGIRFKFKNGTFSEVFHVADTGPPLQGPLTNRVNSRNNPLINYPAFSNIDFSDSEVSENVIGYQIMRVEMDSSKREMLFSGIATPCFQLRSKTNLPKGVSPEPYWPTHPEIVRLPQDWNFPDKSDTWVITSPDIFYGYLNFDRGRPEDEVYVVYGKDYNVKDGGKNSGPINQFYEYDGTSQIEASYGVKDADTINGAGASFDLSEFTPGTILSDGFNQRNIEPLIAPSTISARSLASYPRIVRSAAVFLDGSLTAVNAISFTNELYILPVMYYKRPKTNKFGRKENSIYIPCQQPQKAESLTESTSCFGGDTFTQKSIIHQWFETGEASPNIDTTNAQTVITSFYSENRVNSQLRVAEGNKDGEDLPRIYPQGLQSLPEALQNKPDVVTRYNKAYAFQNGVQNYSGYNPNFDNVLQSETRIYFSLLNPTNSRADRYGEFKPLNYKDLDPNNGPINHMEVANGFLHTWQPRAFSRLYVNMTGLINPEDSTSVLTGSNEVLQKQEKKLSSYGTNHKWSVIKARSQGGNDIVYWYSSDFGKMMRFGGDGSVPISDRDHFSAWFAEEVKGVYKFDTPTHDGGVHGVWDDRFNELLMTFIIPNEDNIVDYTSSALQSAGYLVVNNNGTDADLDLPAGTIIRKDGVLYSVTSKVTVAWSSDDAASIVLDYASPSKRPSSYEEVSLYNPRAYIVKTIVHSDLKNGFSAYYDVRARIYAPIRNRYISQNPDTLTIDLHNEGNYMQFHGRNFEASTKLPVNYDPSAIKVYRAILVASQDKPSRIEFETDAHETYLTLFDIEEREGYFVAPVPLNSSLDGLNDNDSPYMRGPYLLADVIFEPNQYNNLLNIGTKIVMSPRVYRS